MDLEPGGDDANQKHQCRAEVQRPLATAVIGGLATSTALTLLILPTLHVWEERLLEAWARRRGEAKEVPAR